ncbi:hypothetical protein GCM10012275_02480 [Longimycelium tulufanense]|uniref:Uncharacterized protein n=1 Tax=Longimycelium tulufanense TaxID=907463 RepID=A0A8J3FT14_9PSEU|nr:hypothetical protein [Longimycelium tulufanense]GGM34700.1 hypothetical protein GCM10012275_02480 [Longimycelium tulufanense]
MGLFRSKPSKPKPASGRTWVEVPVCPTIPNCRHEHYYEERDGNVMRGNCKDCPATWTRPVR